MNQLCKLDFWTEKGYNAVQGFTYLTDAEILAYLNKQSSGMISRKGTPSFGTGAGTMITRVGTAATDKYAETYYKKGANYIAQQIITANHTVKLFLTTTADALINANNGLELHWNRADFNANGFAWDVSRAARFTINSSIYQIYWTHTSGLLIYVDGVASTWDAGSDAITNFSSTGGSWGAVKLRAFHSGDDLYIKFQGTQAANTVIAQKKVVNGAVSKSFSLIELDSGTNNGCTDNVSLYAVTSSQATTYAGTIDADITGVTITNDMLPFQRYTPLLDLIPIFGTGWTGSDKPVAADDLKDGDLTTYATTDTKDVPIGFIASDGLSDTVTNNEWFMVAAGGASENFTSVGGPDGTVTPIVVGHVFLATDAGTFAANSVYPLLTMGDLMGRAYAWTPGTLTQLPTIGIIRNGSSMAFSVANTEAEDIRFKFGMFDNDAVGGANVSTFKFVQKDVTTGGNPFGETLAVNHFDNGSGEFTDTIDTSAVVSGKKYIVVLAGDGQNLSAVGGPALASTGDTFVATSSGTLAGNYVRVQYTYTTAQPVIFTLERKTT